MSLFFRSLLVILGLLWGAGAAGQGRGYEVVVSVVLGNSEDIKLDTASRQIELHSWFPALNIAYVSNVIDDTKYHNVDNLAAADMIAYPVLDVASVGLSFVGFDFIPEGLGVLYSAYRKDAGNTAIYSASMIFAFGSSPAFRLADELVAVKNLDAEDALYKRLNEVGESDEVLAYTASTSTAEVRSLTQVEANGLSTKVLNYKDLKGTVVNLGSDLDNARLWLGSVSDGRAYVIVHSTGTEFKVLHNGQEVLLSHRSLAKWIESKGLGSQEIVLLSCNDAATAQNLANKLPNAKIGSWSGEVRLFDNGFVEGDGSYKLYQKNTPPATITTPPNGGKTSKPQNGKMVRLGDEVVSGPTRLIEGKNIFRGFAVDYSKAKTIFNQFRENQRYLIRKNKMGIELIEELQKFDARNLAYFEGRINNFTFNSNDIKISGSKFEGDEIFNPYKVDRSGNINTEGAWSREFDTEYVGLSEIAKMLGAKKGRIYEDVIGEITIASELPYCLSCQGVIQDFSNMFPNVKINLIDGIKIIK